MAFPNTTDDLHDLVGIELDGARGRYILERRLGGGAQGCVFLAKRFVEGGQDTVVVKIWRPSFVLAHPDLATLVLKKEYVALARLNDRIPPTPFVVRLLDGGEVVVVQRFATTTLPWLALEYVHGGVLGTTLKERVQQAVKTTGHAFGPVRASRVLHSIVEGVLAIHEAGVVHRDLKPTNVLVCGVGADELAKVADFGLARPLGLQSTFGQLAVGTPGYAAPEQMESDKVGPWSDVFSVAAIAYFAITGEDMFYGTPVLQMANVYSGNFLPIDGRPQIDPTWKGSRALVNIEQVLRRATRRELQARIPSIRELWSALEPPLRDAESRGMHSLAVGTARTLHDASSRPWAFDVVHRPHAPLGLRSVAFDPDGHALAAGEAGLWYWEGARWMPLKPPAGVDAAAIRDLRRLGPCRWMACGDRGTFAIFTPYSCDVTKRLGDVFALTKIGLRTEHDFLLCGHQAGAPIVFACKGGEYRAPVAIDWVKEITSVSPLEGDAWWVTGRDAEGRGILATFLADSGTITRWPIESAALFASVTDSMGAAYAVGAGGFAFRQKEGHPVLERVLSHRNLTTASVDPGDGVWAAAVGRIVHRPHDSVTWSPLWSDRDWTAGFVSIEALSGMVVAAAEDGSLLVGRQEF
jgi:serine/threonine protein kinase